MNILVMGAGGVGGYFGAKLARSGVRVHFLARGEHLAAMQKGGLRILSSSGNWIIPSGSMSDSPPSDIDVVLFCVKTYDTEAAARLLAPALSVRSAILSLQNGVDNEEKLHAIVPQATILGGAAYISARVTAPGEITETGGLQCIVFGPMFGGSKTLADGFLSTLTGAGIKSELREDVRNELWRKFSFITSMGSMTALTRLNHEEMLAHPETMEIVFTAMNETTAVAKASGVPFDPVPREKVLEGLHRFDGKTRSSMYYDLINRKPLEIEALNGTLVRLGRQYKIPTPVHETIYASLLPYHRLHRGLVAS